MESQNFFGLDGLTDLSKRSGIDMRPTLLRVLTDLYMHRLSHSADEERHYTGARFADARKPWTSPRGPRSRNGFAHYQRPPLRVLQWLARDLPMVAGELRSHPLLQAPGAVTRGNGPAEPAKIDPLGEKQQARLPVESIDAGAATELNELFFTATTTERRLILLNMHVVDPNPTLRSRIVTGVAIGQELEGAVLTGKREHFAARLAQALRISHEQARRIANDELGEPVLVAAKTLALRRDVLYRILMFVNPAVGHSVERVHTLAALYDALQAQAAEAMLAIWQALPATERARFGHRTQLQEESRPRARAGATTQRNSAAPQANELRSVS